MICVLFVALIGSPVLPWCGLETLTADAQRIDAQRIDDHVVVELRFNGAGEDRIIKSIPWKDGMTAFDAMMAAARDKKLKFKYRGKGITSFLTEIDGVRNQGSQGDNWIYRINKKLGRKSFGVIKLKSGDTVNWTFGKYYPK